jgi:hypothetical protein
VGDDALAGKKKKKKGKGHPTHVFVDSSFAPGEVNRIPIISLVNTSITAEAESYFFPMLSNALADKPQYVVVDVVQTAREAAEKEVQKDHLTLVRQWENVRKFSGEGLSRVAEALAADYVMACEISEWESKEVEWNVEGRSYSLVEAQIKIFDPTEGKLLVEVRDKIKLQSRLYDPRSHSGGMVDDVGIQRGASGHIVPPAPPVEDAAEQVALNLVSALP